MKQGSSHLPTSLESSEPCTGDSITLSSTQLCTQDKTPWGLNMEMLKDQRQQLQCTIVPVTEQLTKRLMGSHGAEGPALTLFTFW